MKQKESIISLMINKVKVTKKQKAKIEQIRNYLEKSAKATGQKLVKFETNPLGTRGKIEVIARIGEHALCKEHYQAFIGIKGGVSRAYHRTLSNGFDVTKLFRGSLWAIYR